MKHKRAKRKLSNKQALTIVISVACVIALLVGLLIVIGPILGDNSGGHYEGDGHDHSQTGTTADPHAGHNHAAGEECTDTTDTGSTQNSTDKVKYQIYTNTDKTYRVVFRDSAGTAVYEQDKIVKQPVRETVDADKGVYSLGWATGTGPNDYAHIYYNVKTGQVSKTIVAPRGCDGVRVAYGSEDQTKVIVQDLFDNEVYYKEYALADAYTAATDIIIGGKLKDDKKTVTVSYVVDEKGSTRHINVNLYE